MSIKNELAEKYLRVSKIKTTTPQGEVNKETLLATLDLRIEIEDIKERLDKLELTKETS